MSRWWVLNVGRMFSPRITLPQLGKRRKGIRARTSEIYANAGNCTTDIDIETKTFCPCKGTKGWITSELQAQIDCIHPIETLKWGANDTSLYASCKLCGLKSVIILKRLKGDLPITRSVHMVTNARSVRDHQGARDRCAVGAVSSTTFEVRLASCHLLTDTGCRRACRGPDSQRALCREMNEICFANEGRRVRGLFQFGPSPPVVASALWTYTVGVLGAETKLNIYELDSVSPSIDGVPGLLGPDELARWGMRFDFTEVTLGPFRERSDIVPAVSGHPCVSLLSFPKHISDINVQILPLPSIAEGDVAPFSCSDRTLDVLRTVAEAGDASSSGPDGTPVVAHLAERHAAYLQDQDDEASSRSCVEELGDAGNDARHAETSDEDMPPLGSETSKSESSRGTSDHDRGETETESEEASDGDGPSEIFQTQIRMNEVFLDKGEWRHVRGNVTNINEHMQEEQEARRAQRPRRSQAQM